MNLAWEEITDYGGCKIVSDSQPVVYNQWF
jgi:hypothetical protein